MNKKKIVYTLHCCYFTCCVIQMQTAEFTQSCLWYGWIRVVKKEHQLLTEHRLVWNQMLLHWLRFCIRHCGLSFSWDLLFDCKQNLNHTVNWSCFIIITSSLNLQFGVSMDGNEWILVCVADAEGGTSIRTHWHPFSCATAPTLISRDHVTVRTHGQTSVQRHIQCPETLIKSSYKAVMS